ncbi:MAG: response regulator transcription factor [Herpetosiphonaceae bacterium]|nr:response regulator transcription factor [Herpetosiphonaceae bacterium]
MIRILICDDQEITREGLAMLLALEPDITIVGSARDGADAVALASELRPDLVLMDLKMPGMSGIEATRQICQHVPQAKILILTTYTDDPWVIEAIRAGADGYLLKDSPREDLLSAVRGTMDGRTYVDSAVAGALFKQIIQPPPSTLVSEQLSAREYAILQRIVAGMSNAQIADDLQLSDGTVRNYVSVILAKLAVTDRTQAAILAIQGGVLPHR